MMFQTFCEHGWDKEQRFQVRGWTQDEGNGIFKVQGLQGATICCGPRCHLTVPLSCTDAATSATSAATSYRRGAPPYHVWTRQSMLALQAASGCMTTKTGQLFELS